MNFCIWLSNKDVTKILETKGFNFITVRKLLKEFGYKTGEECKKELKVSETLLNYRLAYLDKEFDDLILKFSYVLEALKANKSFYGSQILCAIKNNAGTIEYGLYDNSCHKYFAPWRCKMILKNELQKKYNLDLFL